jgi:hypothetical protein
MFKNIIASLLLSFVLVACKPMPTFMRPPSGGGEIYQKAWKEGCESGFSVYGNTYWRTFYSYNADIKLMNSNRLYSRVWWDSFNFCRHYVNRYLTQGFWGSEGGEGSREGLNSDLRNEKVVEQKGFGTPWSEGANTPGWGAHTWGGDVGNEADWLGRYGSDKTDWLGRKNGGW